MGRSGADDRLVEEERGLLVGNRVLSDADHVQGCENGDAADERRLWHLVLHRCHQPDPACSDHGPCRSDRRRRREHPRSPSVLDRLSGVVDAACVSGGGGANTAPTVEAGPSANGLVGQPIALSGSSTDDGLPNPPGSTTLTWSKVSGPGTAAFSAPNAASSNATFSEAGSYVVKLSASDGALTSSDTVTVSVTTPSTGTTVALIASSGLPAVADRPLRDHLAGLGYTVTVVDDNRVASTSFASADLIVISSSVATANIPTSFSSLGVPILSNDASGQRPHQDGQERRLGHWHLVEHPGSDQSIGPRASTERYRCLQIRWY